MWRADVEEEKIVSPKSFWVVYPVLKFTEPTDHDFDADVDKAVLEHGYWIVDSMVLLALF